MLPTKLTIVLVIGLLCVPCPSFADSPVMGSTDSPDVRSAGKNPLRPAMVKTVSGLSVEKLADAIYWAEGGAKTRHPYGILAKYKTTTPRQACINTIRSKHLEWEKKGKPGRFLEYLAGRYCPVGAKNDPTGLNKNWLGNVEYFLEQEQSLRRGA